MLLATISVKRIAQSAVDQLADHTRRWDFRAGLISTQTAVSKSFGLIGVIAGSVKVISQIDAHPKQRGLGYNALISN